MKQKVGLALAGGGLRGSYQIGAFYALKEHHIKFDIISGTSIGSFNAAMLVAGLDKELLNFWENIDPTFFFELDESFKTKDITPKKIFLIFKTIKEKMDNKGFNLSPLKIKLEEIFSEDKFRNSNIDYGVVTVKGKNPVPVEVTKKDIPLNKTIEYILASCYLPLFKPQELIDNNYYLDGGFYDAVPIEILYKNGCNKIYAIYLNGPGPQRKINDHNVEIIKIKPTKSLGSQLTLDQELIKRNIRLGYYDTLKVLDHLDGIKYYFQYKDLNYYDKLLKNITKKLIDKAYIKFLAKNNKDLIIKILEYILKKENLEIYKIYKPCDIIKHVKKTSDKKTFEYNFIRKLKLFWEW